MPPLTRPVPVLELRADEFANAVNVCFEDYVMPFSLTPSQADQRFRRENLDSEASLVWVDDDGPAAVTLVARRGWTCRLAAMAVAKRHRRQGLGRHVMEAVVDAARTRGDRRFVLEVIEQNPPAIALYEAVGFAVTRRLAGYEVPGGAGGMSDLREVDPAYVAARLAEHGPLDLPWDIQPQSVATLFPPSVGLELDGSCWAVVTRVPSGKVVLWTIVTHRDRARSGLGRRMVEALRNRFPGLPMTTPVTVPDSLCPGFWNACGFSERPVSQFEMAQDLEPA